MIVQIARRDRAVDAMRARITAEEADQRMIQMQIDDRIGMLRRDHERMSAEINRLETRLERLVFARRALSDVELDDEEQVERAEEAAFWAEWRQQREERRGTVINRRPAGDEDITLRQLYRALARLPADQQRVIELRLAGLLGAEIAEVLHRSPSAVRQLQFRAMKRLRELLIDSTAPTMKEGQDAEFR